ncbi:MAG: hypothetical protein ABJN34_03325 [Litoreibacter sp.]|uniref:hypothetical protein n=1 Tax=Litoreibacter sp. TaxID=1969459 RepID=UPI003299E3F8
MKSIESISLLEQIISFEDVGSTEPLGRQFGAIEPATVPDDFLGHFFGAETSFNDVEEDQAPAMMTYAIVDAAKVPQFVQIIEASGLEFLASFLRSLKVLGVSVST